jgi:HlyD family secretion protein
MKKKLPILILLIAAGAGVYMWRSGHFDGPKTAIQVSGNLELTQVDLSFKIAGRMTELYVREGETVKKGQVIAKLDAKQLEEQHARDMAAITGAQSAYDQLITSIAYQQATIDSDIQSKQADLNQAQSRLEELQTGSRPQEIQQSDAALTEARAQLEFAKSDWERAQTLYKNTDISTAQFDQARTRYNAAEAQVKQAEQRTAIVKEGPRKEEIAMAKAQVARAQAAMKTAEANRIEVQRKQQELTARKAEIERARAQAGISEAQLGDTTIVSPIDGVVLVKSAEAGEVIAAGTTVVSIGDIQHPWLRAYVSESDLGKVKLGQKVKLSTDSFPGKVYVGTVSFIASEAEFTPKQIQTKEERAKLVYRIKVEVENTAQELKNNMPVDAEIGL